MRKKQCGVAMKPDGKARSTRIMFVGTEVAALIGKSGLDMKNPKCQMSECEIQEALKNPWVLEWQEYRWHLQQYMLHKGAQDTTIE